MKKIIRLIENIIFAAVIGFSFTACDNGDIDNDPNNPNNPGGGGSDGSIISDLQGIWKKESADIYLEFDGITGTKLNLNMGTSPGGTQLGANVVYLEVNDIKAGFNTHFKVAFEGAKLRVSKTIGWLDSGLNGLYTKQ
jgi:hypothetical protein